MPQRSPLITRDNTPAGISQECSTQTQGLGENLAECGDCFERPGLLETRPLHAHDEMNFAKQRVITLDFVLHERFVTDNKTVLGELLERLLERLRPLRLLGEAP